MEYSVKIEKSNNGYGAYAPDLPGVGVVAETREETLVLIKEADELHLELLKESSKKITELRNHIIPQTV